MGQSKRKNGGSRAAAPRKQEEGQMDSHFMVPLDGMNHDSFGLVCLILLEEKVYERGGGRIDLCWASCLTLTNGNEGS